MNKNQLVFRISTGLLSFMYLAGGLMYFIKFDDMSQLFTGLGFPAWLHPLLGVVKIVAAVLLWAPIPRWLREWTYAGIFFNLSLAVIAHVMKQDGEYMGALVALILVVVSRLFLKHRG